jgi:hypothetical protein
MNDRIRLLTEEGSMNKFGPTAQKEVEKAMHEYKRGDLKSGKSGQKVKSRDQAVAIGLSKARHKGAKAPEK